MGKKNTEYYITVSTANFLDFKKFQQLNDKQEIMQKVRLRNW